MNKVIQWLYGKIFGCDSKVYTIEGFQGRCGNKVVAKGMCAECIRIFITVYGARL